MKKPDIARQIARRSKSSVGEAADALDRMVREIVTGLRHGKEPRLPGLGKFTRDSGGKTGFRAEGDEPGE